MVRSAAAFAAVLVFPGLLLAQEVPRNHTVVNGDTLWDLAASFYGNPFDWRRIWNANRADVQNPNLIVPGQVLTIPDGTVTVTDVMVEGPVDPVPPVPQPRTDPEHTVFFRDAARGMVVAGGQRADYVAVSRDRVYAAPWLIALESEPAHWGVLSAFAESRRVTMTPRTYDRVILDAEGPAARVGTQLLTYRITRRIKEVGEVVTPTGLLTVTDIGPLGPVAVVTKEYERIALGDFVGPVPTYDLVPGNLAGAVTGNAEAMVVGFAGLAELHNVGSLAFLDVGADQGITIGDEFEYWNPAAGPNAVEGTLQVVGVTPRVATARVIAIEDAVFEQGVVVRLSRKMR